MFKRHSCCQAIRKSETYKRHSAMVIIGMVFFSIGIIGGLFNQNSSNIYMLVVFMFSGSLFAFIYFKSIYKMTYQCEMGEIYEATYHDISIKLNERSFRIAVQYEDSKGETHIIESYEYFGWMDVETYRHKRYKIVVVPNQTYATIIEIIHE